MAVTNIRIEKRDITIDPADVKKIDHKDIINNFMPKYLKV